MFFDKHNMNNNVFHIVFIQSFIIPGYGRTQVNMNKCVYGNQENKVSEISMFVTNCSHNHVFAMEAAIFTLTRISQQKGSPTVILTIMTSYKSDFY